MGKVIKKHCIFSKTTFHMPLFLKKKFVNRTFVFHDQQFSKI